MQNYTEQKIIHSSEPTTMQTEFQEKGFVFIPQLLSPAAVDILRKVTDKESGPPIVQYPNGLEVPAKFLAWTSEEISYIALNQHLAEAAAQLLGDADEVQLLYDELIVKEKDDDETPWHQDMEYWPLRGTQVVSFWIALDTIDDQNGGVQYVEGSHAWGRRFKPTNRGEEGYWDDTPGECVPEFNHPPEDWHIRQFNLQPGDAVAHAGFTLHGSGRNLSDSKRRGYVVRWSGPDIRYHPKPKTMTFPFVEGLHSGDKLEPKFHPVISIR